VLISLVYSYTYFVVVRYANFPPAESNKHVHIILLHTWFHNEWKTGQNNVQPPSPAQKPNVCPYELYRNQIKCQPDVCITDMDGTYEYYESFHICTWLVFFILLLYCRQFSIAFQLTECSNEEWILVWFCGKMQSELLTFTQKWQYNKHTELYKNLWIDGSS
jgi:hypothetical protein